MDRIKGEWSEWQFMRKTNFAPINLSICYMPPKLEVKNPRKYVYYCYRWLPWTTWTMYPTSFWWHLHVCDTMLVTFWRIRHDFNRIFYMLATFVLLFFWKCAPRLHRKHNSRWRHKAFLIKNLTFSTSELPVLDKSSALLGYFGLLWPSKKTYKNMWFFRHFRFSAPSSPLI